MDDVSPSGGRISSPSPAARPRAEQVQVVRDLDQRHREHVQDAGKRHQLVMRRHGLEPARGGAVGLTRQTAQFRAESGVEAWRRVEAGADRRAALGYDTKAGDRGIKPPDRRPDLPGEGVEALTDRHGNRIHHVGTADLDDAGELARLACDTDPQDGERGSQVAHDLLQDGDVHHRGEAVVGGLGPVEVVVRMDRRPRPRGLPEQLVGPVGDHLVRVHVGLRAGPGLPDRQGKVRVEAALPHLAGGLLDGAGQCRVDRADGHVR